MRAVLKPPRFLQKLMKNLCRTDDWGKFCHGYLLGYWAKKAEREQLLHQKLEVLIGSSQLKFN